MARLTIRIKGAVGDTDDLESLPSVVKSAYEQWNQNPNDETAQIIIELLSPYIKANFVPINLDSFEEIVPDSTEFNALELVLHGFNFHELDLPMVNATAIFDLPLHVGITQEKLVSWERENNQDLSFAFNFYWEFSEGEVYLYTHSGTDWRIEA